MGTKPGTRAAMLADDWNFAFLVEMDRPDDACAFAFPAANTFVDDEFHTASGPLL